MNQKFDINSTKQRNITEEIEIRKLALEEAMHPERLGKKPNHLAKNLGKVALATIVTAVLLTTAAKGAGLLEKKTETNSEDSQYEFYIEKPYIYSDSTKNYTVESGDGVWNAVEAITGIEETDMRFVVEYVEAMSENSKVDFDYLQPGDIIVIPESVDNPNKD